MRKVSMAGVGTVDVAPVMGDRPRNQRWRMSVKEAATDKEGSSCSERGRDLGPAEQDGQVQDPAKLQVYTVTRVTAGGGGRTTGSKEAPVRTYDEHLLKARSSTNKFRSAAENKRERNIDHFAATGMHHGDNAHDHELKSKGGKEHVGRMLSRCCQRPAAGALRCQPADPLGGVRPPVTQRGCNKKSLEVLLESWGKKRVASASPWEEAELHLSTRSPIDWGTIPASRDLPACSSMSQQSFKYTQARSCPDTRGGKFQSVWHVERRSVKSLVNMRFPSKFTRHCG